MQLLCLQLVTQLISQLPARIDSLGATGCRPHGDADDDVDGDRSGAKGRQGSGGGERKAEIVALISDTTKGFRATLERLGMVLGSAIDIVYNMSYFSLEQCHCHCVQCISLLP